MPKSCLTTVLLCVLALAVPATGGTPSGEAILVDGSRRAGVSITAFHYSASSPGETRVRLNGEPVASELIRWGAPPEPSNSARMQLADGSLLVSDSATGETARVDVGRVGLRRRGGWVEADRSRVTGLVFDASVEELVAAPYEAEADDRVWLASGDRLDTRVASMDAEHLVATVAGEQIELASEQVSAIRFAARQRPETEQAGPACLVGLADGSLLRANAVRLDGGRLEIEGSGISLRVAADRLVFLQPLGGDAVYLSDLEPIDYRHTPYFDLAWPYARDELIGGGTLSGGGRRAIKGLAMHSAARIVYRLDGAPRRFRCEAAIADGASDLDGAGSILLRVYLVRDGRFDPAFESPVVRGGDPAIGIDVDVTGASGLALVVDYADRGDAGDHALWLDARLEPIR